MSWKTVGCPRFISVVCGDVRMTCSPVKADKLFRACRVDAFCLILKKKSCTMYNEVFPCNFVGMIEGICYSAQPPPPDPPS